MKRRCQPVVLYRIRTAAFRYWQYDGGIALTGGFDELEAATLWTHREHAENWLGAAQAEDRTSRIVRVTVKR